MEVLSTAQMIHQKCKLIDPKCPFQRKRIDFCQSNFKHRATIVHLLLVLSTKHRVGKFSFTSSSNVSVFLTFYKWNTWIYFGKIRPRNHLTATGVACFYTLNVNTYQFAKQWKIIYLLLRLSSAESDLQAQSSKLRFGFRQWNFWT